MVAQFGRIGSGPGEFRHVSLLPSYDSANATVFDGVNRRLTLISVDSGSTSQAFVNVLSGSKEGFNPEYRFSDGRMLALMIFRTPGETFGFALPGPYSRRLIAAANDSSILIASTGEFSFKVYSHKGTLRCIVRVNGLRRPVTKSIRKAYRSELMATATDAKTRRTWEARSADEVFQDSLPAFDQLMFDRRGNIWSRRSATADELSAEWLVFSVSGMPLAVVTAPRAFTFRDILDSSILGIWTDEWSREQVREYQLARSSDPRD